MTQVWDFSRHETVKAAQRFLHAERLRNGSMAADVALAVQEAVNCSSQARQTPLHAAAEDGNAEMVKVCMHPFRTIHSIFLLRYGYLDVLWASKRCKPEVASEYLGAAGAGGSCESTGPQRQHALVRDRRGSR
jgi:ankyrin repeat protein